MTVDTDLSTPLSQVRAIIGDTEGELITDQTITALLLANSDNVNKTAIQCLQFIVADLAKCIREETGDVQVWYHQLYDHYRDLLDDLLTNPAQMLAPAVHLLGGTSCSEARRVNSNPDSRRIRIKEGFGTRLDLFEFDPYNIDFVRREDGCGEC